MHVTIYLHSDGHAVVERNHNTGAITLDLAPAAELGVPNVTMFFDSLESARDWLAKVTDGIKRLERLEKIMMDGKL